MIIKNDNSIQEIQPCQPASEASRSSSKGDTFVKAIAGKARSLIKSFEHSFSSSTIDREKDVSCLTIEFLYERLQAQRSIYRAEKQQVQQLLKKVMELEEKLRLETLRSRKAECKNVPVSSTMYGNRYPRNDDNSLHCTWGSCSMISKGSEEKGVTIGSSHIKVAACYTMKHHKRHIDEDTTHHADGSEVHQLCLGHQCECHGINCQQLPLQHCSPVDKCLNATSNQNSSETSTQKGTRKSVDSELCSEDKTKNGLELAKSSLNIKAARYGEEGWNNVHKRDAEDLEENTYAPLNSRRKPGLLHELLPKTAASFGQLAGNSSLECSSSGSSKNLIFIGTSKCSVTALNSQREHHSLEGIMSSPKKVNLGAFVDFTICSPSMQDQSQYNSKQDPECSLHNDILMGSKSSKEIKGL